MGPPRFATGVLCLVIVCGVCSCAKRSHEEQLQVFPVSGQVFFDGKPTPGAIVVFFPVDDPDQIRPHPRATVDRDGNFKLTTYRANDGAPAGDLYRDHRLAQGRPWATPRMPPACYRRNMARWQIPPFT